MLQQNARVLLRTVHFLRHYRYPTVSRFHSNKTVSSSQKSSKTTTSLPPRNQTHSSFINSNLVKLDHLIMSPPTSQNNERRSVSFPEQTVSQIYHILPLDDYTPAEISASWYNDDENNEMARKCHKIIKRMKKGEADNYCTRGLERMTGARKHQVKHNRTQAYDAVLGEQDSQWSQGINDPNTISEVYFFEASYFCQCEATKIGQLDAMVARSYYLSQSEAKRTQSCVTPSTKKICTVTRRRPVVIIVPAANCAR
jgi:hypothetical protein